MKGKRKGRKPRLFKKVVIDVKSMILGLYHKLSMDPTLLVQIETPPEPITGSYLRLNPKGTSAFEALLQVAKDLVVFVRQPSELDAVFTVRAECELPQGDVGEMEDITLTKQELLMLLLTQASVFNGSNSWASAFRKRTPVETEDLNRMDGLYIPPKQTAYGEESVLHKSINERILKAIASGEETFNPSITRFPLGVPGLQSQPEGDFYATRALAQHFDIHVQKPACLGGGEHVHRVEIVKQRVSPKTTHTIQEFTRVKPNEDWIRQMDELMPKFNPGAVGLPKLEKDDEPS